MIAADCIAIGVTWATLARRHDIRHLNIVKGSLSSILLVDGTVYFLILAVLNSLHLAFTLLALAVEALAPTSVITNFTIPLSSVLVSRFLLHLQSTSLQSVGSVAFSQAFSMDLDHSLIFEGVVGSLGASITRDDYIGQEDDSVDSDHVCSREENSTQTSIGS
ncbi:hypothetical protein BD311DRAFT_221169 [Dichomitus squalens]|uniref:Uncharacterized protein n=1 Tax=Dichomitus squalens TaxID=114155 RepID=A0A4V2JYL7_9APHY|nr:hypothetical protein BD311DRAFT_221169 [Dichomitus squalens]